MAAENAESEVIKDAEPQPIREKESKRLGSRKTKEEVDIEEFVHAVEKPD